MAKALNTETVAAPEAPAPKPARRVVRVENNTAHAIVLAPTANFPFGFTLKPGLSTPPSVDVFHEEDDGSQSTVPVQYFEELFAYQVTNAEGKKWYPGRRQIAELERTTRIVTPRGERHGPQITIYEVDQVTRPDGFVPDSIDHYWKEYRNEQDEECNVAIDMLRMINDRAALQRYAKQSKYGPIRNLAQSKLNGQG